MKINLIKKKTFYICGYSVETALADNNKDVSALYNDFFRSGKEFIIRAEFYYNVIPQNGYKVNGEHNFYF